MNMRDLNRRAKNQQQSAAKSKGEPPRVSRVVFGLLIVHHSNYNVPLLHREDGGCMCSKRIPKSKLP
jgi:hypothetical protein